MRHYGYKQWLDNEGRFRFGKHHGESVEDVSIDDPGYIHWVLENVDDMDPEDYEIMEYWARRSV